MKRLLLTLILIASIIPISSAVEATLKENYAPGETLIISIAGNFLDPLNADSIAFYSGRIPIPMSYTISKIEDRYYLYALLQSQVRNYTLKIKNAHFMENGLENKLDLEYNFSVSGNITDFSVDPGFVIAREEFSISLQSKSKTIVVTLKSTNSTKSITLSAGQTKEVSFFASDFTSPISSIEISSPQTTYLVPVKLSSTIFQNNHTKNQTAVNKTILSLEFIPSIINITSIKGNATSINLFIKNTGNTNLTNITISSSDKVLISPSKIELIQPDDSITLNLTILPLSSSLFAMLRATSENITSQIPLYVSITYNSSAVILPPSPPPLDSCNLLGGKICAPGENCNGNLISSQEGSCCKGTCVTPKQPTSNTSKYIAIMIIAAIVGIIGFFVYKKSKAKKKDFTKVIEEKNKSFEKKLNPGSILDGEVRGQLTKN